MLELPISCLSRDGLCHSSKDKTKCHELFLPVYDVSELLKTSP